MEQAAVSFESNKRKIETVSPASSTGNDYDDELKVKRARESCSSLSSEKEKDSESVERNTGEKTYKEYAAKVVAYYFDEATNFESEILAFLSNIRKKKDEYDNFKARIGRQVMSYARNKAKREIESSSSFPSEEEEKDSKIEGREILEFLSNIRKKKDECYNYLVELGEELISCTIKKAKRERKTREKTCDEYAAKVIAYCLDEATDIEGEILELFSNIRKKNERNTGESVERNTWEKTCEEYVYLNKEVTDLDGEVMEFLSSIRKKDKFKNFKAKLGERLMSYAMDKAKREIESSSSFPSEEKEKDSTDLRESTETKMEIVLPGGSTGNDDNE